MISKAPQAKDEEEVMLSDDSSGAHNAQKLVVRNARRLHLGRAERGGVDGVGAQYASSPPGSLEGHG
ncbi:hypothetical protein MTO96_024921 [Rhipicephalus appendiculatus]